MSTEAAAAERIAKIKRTALKAAVIAAAALNAFVVLPGIIMGVATGHYAPSIALVLLSLAVWGAGWGIANLLRGRRERAEKAQAPAE